MDMYSQCPLFDDSRHNFGNTVPQLSTRTHRACFMLMANMSILMTSVGVGWMSPEWPPLESEDCLVSTCTICAFLPSQVELSLSSQSRTPPALSAMQKCHQICQKRFALCETGLIKFYQLVSLWMFLTSFLVLVSESLPTAKGRPARL